MQRYDIHILVDGIFSWQESIHVNVFCRRQPWINQHRRSIQNWKNWSCSCWICWWDCTPRKYIMEIRAVLIFPDLDAISSFVKTFPCQYSTKKRGSSWQHVYPLQKINHGRCIWGEYKWGDKYPIYHIIYLLSNTYRLYELDLNLKQATDVLKHTY